MSDFPRGGDVQVTRAWLDNEGFIGAFVGWKADAILGLEKVDILSYLEGEIGLKLCGFLNTAKMSRSLDSGTSIHKCLQQFVNHTHNYHSKLQ